MSEIKVSDTVGKYVDQITDWLDENPYVGKYIGEVDYDEVLMYTVIYVGENCEEKLTDVDKFCRKIIEMFDYCYECILKSKPNLKNRFIKEGFAMELLFGNMLSKILGKQCNFVEYFEMRFV